MPCCRRSRWRSVSSPPDGSPELPQLRWPLTLVQHAQHDLFAVHRAQRGHAEVDLPVVIDLHTEPAILGQALLGDVHAGQYLHARDETVVDPLGEREHLAQDAIEAVAHDDTIPGRLDVDIAGPPLHRPIDDATDEVDNRRLVSAAVITSIAFEEEAVIDRRERAGQIALGAAVTPGGPGHDRRPAGIITDRRKRFVGIAGIDGGQDVGLLRDDLPDAEPGPELEIQYHVEDQWIHHGHGQLFLLALQRDTDTLQRNAFGNQCDRARLGWLFRGIHIGEPQLECQGLGNLRLAGEPQPDQHGAKTFPGTSVLCEGRLQIMIVDETRLDEALTDQDSHAGRSQMSNRDERPRDAAFGFLQCAQTRIASDDHADRAPRSENAATAG